MSVFVSTGGNKKLTPQKSIEYFKGSGIKCIELSGGTYSENLTSELVSLKKDFKFQIHNYFPPAKESFVINLASQDKEVEEKSLNFVRRSIELASMIGGTHYSFHAGFLLDPKPKELGNKLSKVEIFDRDKAKATFYKNVKNVSNLANDFKIKLLIENNVVSNENLNNFKINPFLISEPKETSEFLKLFKKSEVNILLDVAHLKVSANSLKFKAEDFFNVCGDRIGGYHLSENDGLKDSNEPFDNNSWFWKYINKKVNYFTLEVYNTEPSELKKLAELVEKKISQN